MVFITVGLEQLKLNKAPIHNNKSHTPVKSRNAPNKTLITHLSPSYDQIREKCSVGTYLVRKSEFVE